MIIINSHIYHLDTELAKFQHRINDNPSLDLAGSLAQSNGTCVHSADVAILHDLIKSLSVGSVSQPLLRVDQVKCLISNFPQALLEQHELPSEALRYVSDLSWLAAAKALVQVLGITMSVILERVQDINEESLYWDDILGSNWHTAMYTMQTFPIRLWLQLRDSFVRIGKGSTQPRLSTSTSTPWVQFYDLLYRSPNPLKLYSLRTTLQSPFIVRRSEIRRKRETLMAMKIASARNLGLLMGQCLRLGTDGIPINADWAVDDSLRDVVCRSVVMLKVLLQRMVREGPDFVLEDEFFRGVEREIAQSRPDIATSYRQPKFVIEQLSHITGELLPNYVAYSRTTIDTHARPSCLVRYWLPLSVALLSGSTSLRILTSRRHELIRWISDIGSTTFEFWGNWVVEPIRRLIGTIRHDEKSEIALMSKNSLEADRSSLERMVLDFVIDRGELGKEEFAAMQVHSITAKIREGDLTPVLRAYENDLRNPFIGAIRGDLVRALLIQIQKTKVDVEIAIGGIDSLLKSQELVFGFVGLTPGIMVTYAFFRWLFGLFGNRKGLRMGRRQHEMRHALRNVDRTLTLSTPTDSGILTFKDHGLLVCDAEALLQKAATVLRGVDFREFQEDIGDLLNIQNGVHRQLQVVSRIGWVYSKWIR